MQVPLKKIGIKQQTFIPSHSLLQCRLNDMAGRMIFSHSTILRSQPPSRGFTPCRSSMNGASLNGSSHTIDNQETVEMHIATESFDEDYEDSNGLQRRNSVHVTPPRNGAPQQLERHTGHYLTGLNNGQDRAEIKAVRAELSMTHAELRAKDTELVENERSLRAREAEITLLRAALTGRDISLRNAKAEAAEAQSSLQEKDGELQNAFEQLMANAKERGNLRQTLLSIQEELVQTRAELQNWTDKGFELNNPPENTNKENESVRQPTNGKSRTNLEQEQISKLLQNLSKLSQTIVDDALADEQAMNSFAS